MVYRSAPPPGCTDIDNAVLGFVEPADVDGPEVDGPESVGDLLEAEVSSGED